MSMIKHQVSNIKFRDSFRSLPTPNSLQELSALLSGEVEALRTAADGAAAATAREEERVHRSVESVTAMEEELQQLKAGLAEVEAELRVVRYVDDETRMKIPFCFIFSMFPSPPFHFFSSFDLSFNSFIRDPCCSFPLIFHSLSLSQLSSPCLPCLPCLPW